MRQLILLVFLVAWSVDSALGAKVWFHEEAYGWLNISGEITHGDYRKVVNKILEHGTMPSRLNIRSPGGNAMEAIKIGRLVRAGLINVSAGMPCNSACALIYFAGVPNSREAPLNIPLGIHRPYFEKRYFGGLSIEEARKKYKQAEQEVIPYLYEMKVPTIVIEKMMSVPSDDVFWLSQKKYRKLAGAMAPVFEEWIKARCNSLSEKEWEDWIYILTYSDSYNRLLKEEGPESAKLLWEGGAQMSKEYIEYIRNKREEWNECRWKAVVPERVKYFNKLLREYVAKHGQVPGCRLSDLSIDASVPEGYTRIPRKCPQVRYTRDLNPTQTLVIRIREMPAPYSSSKKITPSEFIDSQIAEVQMVYDRLYKGQSYNVSRIDESADFPPSLVDHGGACGGLVAGLPTEYQGRAGVKRWRLIICLVELPPTGSDKWILVYASFSNMNFELSDYKAVADLGQVARRLFRSIRLKGGS